MEQIGGAESFWFEAMLNAAHYAAINLLWRSSHTQSEISRLTGHDRDTIRKVLRLSASSLIVPACRKKKMDAFEDYAKQCLKAGQIKSVQLLASLNRRGFDGSLRPVQQFVRRFRGEQHKDRLSSVVMCGSSLLTDDHLWILRLMQGGIKVGDLRTELGKTLSRQDAQFIADTVRRGRLSLRNRALTVAAHLKGIPARSVYQFLLIDRATVREYLKRFHEGGLEEMDPEIRTSS